MIKKMRRRVIVAAMLAFFAVIMMIAILVNAVNYGIVTRRSDETLAAILSYEDKASDKQGPKGPPPGPFMGLPDVEANYMTRFFIVRFDSEGNVVFTSTDYIAAVDSEDAVEMARRVLVGSKQRGYMKAYRYVKASKGNETEVVFLNTGREQQSMLSLLILTVVVSLVSLLIVFVLVTIMSKRAIRPFANNIRQQKQFITDASHELKTPLTSISTSLDVITMEHGEDEWTQNIRNQTSRMTEFVGKLVTLSRFDEDMPLPNKERFSLSEAAQAVAGVFKPRIDAHEKKFTTDIEDGVSVLGDEEAVRQMLSVLLDNAVRYSDEHGEIRLSVFKKRNRAYIEVFNTCSYDKVPDVDRLFDRFYRPDESRNSETGGNGVGLSIAKAVAQAHGGKIEAICPSGKTMTIRIII